METTDFDTLWDYGDPAGTEQKFRELLPRAADKGVSYHAQLLTQIARTMSLRRSFDEAHALLDTVEPMLTDETPRARIRYLLERGRTFNSSGAPERARPLFLEACEIGEQVGEENLAVDAAHMMGIVEPTEEAIRWTEKAMAMAEAAADPAARKWLGPLYNNVGWTYHDAGRYDEALAIFEKALAWRREFGSVETTRIAQYCVGRCLRSMGRLEEALAIQQGLKAEMDADGSKDGFVSEELGECLLALGREEESRNHFARAHELLSQDGWLTDNEPERLTRLKTLAG